MTFAVFLKKDQAKRDFLLSFLVKHHINEVDDLITKDCLSYADVVQRLMDIDTSKPVDHTALYTAKPSGNKRKAKTPKGNSDSSPTKPKT